MGFCSRIQEDKVSFKKFEKVSGLACHQTFLQIVLKEMVELRMLSRLPGYDYFQLCFYIQLQIAMISFNYKQEYIFRELKQYKMEATRVFLRRDFSGSQIFCWKQKGKTNLKSSLYP